MCRKVASHGSSQFLKDLSTVTDQMHRCVLVDNNPISFILQVIGEIIIDHSDPL